MSAHWKGDGIRVRTDIVIQTVSGCLEAAHPLADPDQCFHETQSKLSAALRLIDNDVFEMSDRSQTMEELPLDVDGASCDDAVRSRVDHDDGEVCERYGAQAVELRNPGILARVGHS